MHKGQCCISGEDREICLCRNSVVIDLISRKWSLLIIWLLGKYQELRYNEIAKKLDGVNPNTLSMRLDELEDAGLITRQRFKEIPPRVEYSLTDIGKELSKLTKPLLTLTERAKGSEPEAPRTTSRG
jgi:DNA-binding HxlR family transcriptional regulator